MLTFFILAGVLLGSAITGEAQPRVSTDIPIQFFTNVASRLLHSELNLDLNRIQIYPTNQYTPAVHRLLQLTANLYDCTTNRPLTGYPYLPSVFRPVFTNDADVIYICGYVEETGTNLLQAAMIDVTQASDRQRLHPLHMVYGVPVIIGAKKGYPNFNELAMQTLVQVTRSLQFRRPDGSPNGPVSETNQMYTLSISNGIGIEAWNSYASSFSRDLQLFASADIVAVVTNEFGGAENVLLTNAVHVPALPQSETQLIPAFTWPGFVDASHQLNGCFKVPLSPITSHFFFLLNSTYSQARRAFVPYTAAFERTTGNPSLPVPHWWLQLRTRLRFALVDVGVGRIVDYVNLDATEAPLDIDDCLLRDTIDGPPACGSVTTNHPYNPRSPLTDGFFWCTNRYGQVAESSPTHGILSQIGLCLGLYSPQSWSGFARVIPPGMDENGAVDFFRTQFGFSPKFYPGTRYVKTNVFGTPFNPLRNLYYFTTWQANDPLVHYTVGDLVVQTNRWDFNAWTYGTITNLGRLNSRYEPWAYTPSGLATTTIYEPAVKDPLVTRSDAWDFPSNAGLDLGWLGRVHRGTPWQTVYLKSGRAEPRLWVKWSGATPAMASPTHPTNDWRLPSLLAPLFSTNDPRTQLSINRAGLADWSSALDGLTVLTNYYSDSLHFAPVQMRSNSPQAAIIANALVQQRARQPGGVFRDVGDVLATPALSMASPWLNTNNWQSAWAWVNDLALEAIPSQLLSRLRPDSLASAAQGGGNFQVHFTGQDDYRYVVEASSDLVVWQAVSTNYPSNGVFEISEPLPAAPVPRFYRSVLVP